MGYLNEHQRLMIDLLKIIAALGASLFAGAALYINVAEHPARMLLDTPSAVRQWAPSYKRATWLQASMAIVSCLAGIAVCVYSSDAAWLIGAVLVGAVVPFTFIGIMPTNHRLLAPTLDLTSSEARALLMRWGRLHAVRTVLSLAAAGMYSWLIVQS